MGAVAMDFAALNAGAAVRPIQPPANAVGSVKRVWLVLCTEHAQD